MMLMCPPDVDTGMHHTVGAAAPVNKMTISPGVPTTECKTFLQDRFEDTAVVRYTINRMNKRLICFLFHFGFKYLQLDANVDLR